MNKLPKFIQAILFVIIPVISGIMFAVVIAALLSVVSPASYNDVITFPVTWIGAVLFAFIVLYGIYEDLSV